MKKNNILCERYKIMAVLFALISYICWVILYLYAESMPDVSSNAIFFASWLGIIVCIIYVIVWKKLTGKYFTPLNIFLAFFAIFNFGQCFLWAFGVHSNNEIGKQLIFSSITADNLLIYKAQLLFIICYIAFNTGAICIWSNKNIKEIKPISYKNINNDLKYKTLFITSTILSFYAIPTTLYQAVIKLRYSQIYSYHDLYYGMVSSSLSNPIIVIGTQMFFISLIGLLIGSGFRKNIRRFVYFIFILYASLSLLCGDRGEWIKPLIFLIWTHMTLYKPIDTKKAIKLIIISFVGLYFMTAIVNLRNIGLSIDGFITALSSSDFNPITSILLEFGQSMGICMIVIKNHVICPYGNTYLMTLPTLFGTGIGNKLFGLNYVQLHTWFPLEYLKINYGTDFSIIGEAVLNYGEYIAPIILFIEGLIISKIAFMPYKYNEDPLKLCLSISCMSSIVKIARSTVWLTMNEICFTVILFSLLYIVIKNMLFVKINHNI